MVKRQAFFFLAPYLFFAVNCSHAQSSGHAGGEVIVMGKTGFLSKVFNYEKNSSEWVFEGKRPCVIDFYADWCGPCKRIAPIMKELAVTYKGKVDFYKIDVDVERELASVFGISSIPLVLYVPMNGKPQAVSGASPKNEMVEQIEQFLLGKEKK
ncbi:MAG: thiol reductase thioredoxin [Tannerella sp.]|nr:thiol reductase thioredoxin [Tannerella sp.]